MLVLTNFASRVGDIEANCEAILDKAEEYPNRLIVFPELALIGYSAQDLLLRADIKAAIQSAINTLCAALPAECGVIVGAPYYVEARIFNTAFFIHANKVQAVKCKSVLPNYGVFDERRYFSPGSPDPVHITYDGARYALLICEEIWHTRCLHGLQPDIAGIIAVNASPYRVGKQAARYEQLAKLAKRAPRVFYANACYAHDELLFDGASCVVANEQDTPRVAETAAFNATDLVVSEGTVYRPMKAAINDSTKNQTAVLLRGLTEGIRAYAEANHFHGAIIGLSGGVDSALVAVLAAHALGAANVKLVFMPSQYTSRQSADLAHDLADNLGIGLITLPIDETVATLNAAIMNADGALQKSTSQQNIQSRARMVLLMAMANEHGHLLLATGNKSELAMGYATLYGDMAGGYAPLRDVYKTEVYEIAEYLNRAHGGVIPKGILTRAPTAELAANQKDTDNLPPYPVLDAVLKRLLADRAQVSEVAAEFANGRKKVDVARIARTVFANEFKRYQAPPGPRVSEEAFGINRRYPLTQGWV